MPGWASERRNPGSTNGRLSSYPRAKTRSSIGHDVREGPGRCASPLTLTASPHDDFGQRAHAAVTPCPTTRRPTRRNVTGSDGCSKCSRRSRGGRRRARPESSITWAESSGSLQYRDRPRPLPRSLFDSSSCSCAGSTSPSPPSWPTAGPWCCHTAARRACTCVGGARLGVVASIPRPALQDAKFWTWTCQMQIRPRRRWLHGAGARERQRVTPRPILADVHFLLVAGNHLRKALERGEVRSARSLLSSETSLALEQLRNAYEHWDRQRWTFEQEGRLKFGAGLELTKRHPDGFPWKYSWSSVDGASEGCSTSRRSPRSSLRSAGRCAPPNDRFDQARRRTSPRTITPRRGGDDSGCTARTRSQQIVDVKMTGDRMRRCVRVVWG